MWDSVPCPGVKPRPLHWEEGLATGPPGKSLCGRSDLCVLGSTWDLVTCFCLPLFVCLFISSPLSLTLSLHVSLLSFSPYP